MTTTIENIASLTIGSVEGVSPSDIQVHLELDAPQATALNTGVPTGFPRINGYVLIPNETGAVVGLVSSLRIERSNYPKRPGLKDYGLIDLPFPLRKMALTPVGTLVVKKDEFRLERGVPVLPSVGDPVLLPTRDQLRSIIETTGPNERVLIGEAPFANNARVTIDPDKLFGRHLAVLGNTGSGKSCSVAGLVRWSLDAARDTLDDGQNINARFIILDPNGEYEKAFEEDGIKSCVFSVGGGGVAKELTVPAWLWNSQEWTAITGAQPGVQRPTLMRALRSLRNQANQSDINRTLMRRQYEGHLRFYEQTFAGCPGTVQGFPQNKNFAGSLEGVVAKANYDLALLAQEQPQDTNLVLALTTLATDANTVRQRRIWNNGNGYDNFWDTDVSEVIRLVEQVINTLGEEANEQEKSEDTPVPFEVASLPSQLEGTAIGQGGNTVANIEPLVNRIQVMLSDLRLKPIISPEQGVELAEWLDEFLGKRDGSDEQVAVINLSLVPSEIMHLTISVIARLVFESLQRYKKANYHPMPTVLVLEEAHNFVRRDAGDQGSIATVSDMCRQTFEKIAREGRKFGLGLVLSSQRPSELSSTVLAQCNSFLLHRIVNDTDQALIRRLVPDALGSLLGELPTLPSQQAILLGWATPLPVLVKMNDLPESQRPQSDDPDYWDVWTGIEARNANWQDIANEWQGAADDADE